MAERIAGKYGHVDYRAIPWVVYTHPEIAWVGRTEEELAEAGVIFRVGTFPFMANGRARTMGTTEGFVKILADAKTDEVLGVHMIGPMVSELIAEAVMAMTFKATSEDIGPHLPCPSDLVRSGERSGAGGGWPGAEHVVLSGLKGKKGGRSRLFCRKKRNDGPGEKKKNT